ncbi:MAG: hypothetical protein JST92_10000 [Deltaproteobacteria bacterium]|nr:hypothetical protein [Deltaproteobacteria bacterium]
MIRIVTLSVLPIEVIDHVTRRVHAAYGLGCEIEGEAHLPKGARDKDTNAFDGPKLLAEIDDKTMLYADDKLLYITSEPVSTPPGPMGRGPISGYAQYGQGKAVVTSHGLGAKGALGLESGLAKRAAHQVGHLWDLHHCFDPRCAMHPDWAPGFTQYPEVALCLFCREKSERKIKLGQG